MEEFFKSLKEDYEESTGYLDYQQYGFDPWLREDQIYVPRFSADGDLLPNVALSIC